MKKKKGSITFKFVEVDGQPAADIKTRGNVEPDLAIQALTHALIARLNALYPTDRLKMTYGVFSAVSDVVAKLGEDVAVSPELSDELDEAIDNLGKGE